MNRTKVITDDMLSESDEIFIYRIKKGKKEPFNYFRKDLDGFWTYNTMVYGGKNEYKRLTYKNLKEFINLDVFGIMPNFRNYSEAIFKKNGKTIAVLSDYRKPEGLKGRRVTSNNMYALRNAYKRML